MDYSTIIDRLEDDIRQYRIEFQRFFNGDSHIPPEEHGARIRKRLTSLVGAPQMSAVDRYRLGGLESRYNSFTELFRRRLRDMDYVQRASLTAAAAASDPAVVDLGAASEAGDVERLYDAIYAQRSKKIGLDDFHSYLVDQAAKVRQRTGCEKVRFTIRDEDGKPKLKARALKARPSKTAL